MESGLGEVERLGRRFDAAMVEINDSAARHGLTRFLEMVVEHGSVATAHQLLAANKIQDGLAQLFLRGRLDLTVEHHVLLPEYKPPFSDAERRVAQMRLGVARRSGGQP